LIFKTIAQLEKCAENPVFASFPGRVMGDDGCETCKYFKLLYTKQSNRRIVQDPLKAIGDQGFDIAKRVYCTTKMTPVMDKRVISCTIHGG
jgi:hypothetical protein